MNKPIRTCMLTAMLLCVAIAAGAAPQANVVFILVDDMGWTAPACFGSDLHETPNIDRLASEGVRFTSAYSASPVCSPTRAAILTGKDPARLHMTIWREGAVSRLTSPGDRPLAPPVTEPNLALRYLTLAEQFRNGGYHTIHVGKWHLGDAEHYPEAHGFDVNIGGSVWGAPYSYWYPYQGMQRSEPEDLEYRYVPGLALGKEGEYLTDRLTDEAIGALDAVRNDPFFLYLAYHSPHTPIQGKPDLVAYYEKKRREGMDHTNARFAAMVHSLDENIGRLLGKIEEWGLADNTAVIFYSDNGGFTEVRDGEAVASNAPLRSGKGSVYEGGIRVPLIIKWPGLTQAGAVCGTPVTSMDLYVTLLEGTGMHSALAAAEPLDGMDLTPLLRDPGAKLDRDTLCWHYPHYYFNTSPVTALRHENWKLIEYYEDGRLELYDLASDLGETRDRAQEHPERVTQLHKMMDAWRTRVEAQLPTPNTARLP